ncbi:MAG TPA: Calx-beta domain-containing protein, partial [Solirubrobacteraceae bacterium]|nr:Calx-beta domain-containing protein [Solirubrobacteraceae bacterium]
MRRALLLAVLATAVVAAPAHGGAHDATAPIAIPISGQTSPYPVNLAVFGEPGPITDVNVTLFDVSHSNPDDLDIGIRSPAGTFVVLTSDACGVGDVVNRTWTFDDEAAAPVQDAGSCNTSPASYEPEDYEADTWPGGTPPEAGDDLSLFDGQNPTGRWSLYVFDDAGSNGGDIGGGFRVTIAIGASQIAIPGGAASMGPAAPFPAVQDVATPGIITDLDVLLEGVTHRLPADVEVVLEGPRGQTVGLLADACSAASVANREWVIDDEVTGTFLSPCTSGSYRPAGAAQSLPAPAPGAPYGTSLSAFDLTDADGAWKLWVNDDALDNAGYVIDGYTLQMQTRPGATVGFDGDVGAFEGTVAQLLVTRGGASPLGEGTVRVQTQDATAQAGSDYTAVDQTLTFA